MFPSGENPTEDKRREAYHNPDGKIHECKEKIVNDSVPANSNGNGNDISLEVFLKKLQSIGITIDINKLRNCEINNNANK